VIEFLNYVDDFQNNSGREREVAIELYYLHSRSKDLKFYPEE
jgi:hypothetical protein